MVPNTYIIIILKIKIIIPWCDTVGKTFLDDSTAIVNMNYKMKDNYTEKYCTIVYALQKPWSFRQYVNPTSNHVHNKM
jgi:hypothetical protein